MQDPYRLLMTQEGLILQFISEESPPFKIDFSDKTLSRQSDFVVPDIPG